MLLLQIYQGNFGSLQTLAKFGDSTVSALKQHHIDVFNDDEGHYTIVVFQNVMNC